MIDVRTEEVLTLAEAAKLKFLPRRRRGAKPHLATLHRWATHGSHGVVLETVRIGSTLCTSVEAVVRFIERTTTAKPAVAEASPAPTTPARRAREVARAVEQCEAAGL